jgi:hypothetical protein
VAKRSRYAACSRCRVAALCLIGATGGFTVVNAGTRGQWNVTTYIRHTNNSLHAPVSYLCPKVGGGVHVKK